MSDNMIEKLVKVVFLVVAIFLISVTERIGIWTVFVGAFLIYCALFVTTNKKDK